MKPPSRLPPSRRPKGPAGDTPQFRIYTLCAEMAEAAYLKAVGEGMASPMIELNNIDPQAPRKVRVIAHADKPSFVEFFKRCATNNVDLAEEAAGFLWQDPPPGRFAVLVLADEGPEMFFRLIPESTP